MVRPIVTLKPIGRNKSLWVRKLFPCCGPKIRKDRAYYSKRFEGERINVNTDFRKAFNESFVFHNNSVRDDSHSHPAAANDRRSAETSIKTFITERGMQPYSVSPSVRDVRANVDSERLFYHAKDVDQPFRLDVLTDRHVLYMIDVDYHTDMVGWLLRGRPILSYTFVPKSVAGKCTDGRYYFDRNELHTTHHGGGIYEHQLWDYGLDHFVIDDQHTGWSLMVKVDQVTSPNDEQRRIVCLTPTTWYPSDYNRKLQLDPSRLERLTVQFGDVNIMIVHDKDETFVSAGFCGVPSSVRMRYDMFVGLCKRLSLDKKPSVATVERYLNGDKIKDAGILAPIVFDAFANGWFETKYAHMKKVLHAGVARTAPSYQATAPLLNDEGEVAGVAVDQPVLANAAAFPRTSFNNDVQAIEGRVTRMRNTKQPNAFLLACAQQFIEAFPLGVAYPLSESEVMEEQDRPQQKVRNEQNKHWLKDKFTVRAFMKKEPYAKVTDPRNISTVPTSHTIQLSRYTYGAKTVLKSYPWFIPGKTPAEITQLVRDFVIGESSIGEIDYSRMDGTISEFLRKLERGVYLRLYQDQYHEEINKLFNDEINARAYTATGTKYDPGFSRLSGSPLTTDGNTLIAAFVLYAAARRATIIQSEDKERLHKIPGLVYGDDGLVKQIPRVVLERTVKQLGLTLKYNKRDQGGKVMFLARVFVDPWSTGTSCQDPVRALGKIHLSSIKHVDKRIVAVNKAKGYLVTDPRTPLISNWCRHVISKHPEVTDALIEKYKIHEDRNWWARTYESESWEQHDYDDELLLTIVAESLGVPVSTVTELASNIDAGDWDPLEYQLPTTIQAEVHSEAGDTFIVSDAASTSSRSSSPTV